MVLPSAFASSRVPVAAGPEAVPHRQTGAPAAWLVHGGAETITIRGHQQVLRLYGPRSGRPVIVSSGDGGWIHLGPQVAEVLAAKGYFVVGFDRKPFEASQWQMTLRVKTSRAINGR